MSSLEIGSSELFSKHPLGTQRETVRAEERPADETETRIESQQKDLIEEAAKKAAILHRGVIELAAIVKKARELDIPFPEDCRGIADIGERALQRIEGIAHNSSFSINAVTLIDGLKAGWNGVGPNEFGVLNEMVEKGRNDLEGLLQMASIAKSMTAQLDVNFYNTHRLEQPAADGNEMKGDKRNMYDVLEEALASAEAPTTFLRHLSDLTATMRRAEQSGIRLKLLERPRYRDLAVAMNNFNRESSGLPLGMQMGTLILNLQEKLAAAGVQVDRSKIEAEIRHDLGLDDDQKPETD
jgi:hypothetical protein